MSKKYLIIEADTNDGDYVTAKHVVTDEILETIAPMIEAIRKFEPYEGKSYRDSPWTHHNNYPKGECCREDLGQIEAFDYYVGKMGVDEDAFYTFDDLCPYGEYGIHTIESIDLLEVVKETSLL